VLITKPDSFYPERFGMKKKIFVLLLVLGTAGLVSAVDNLWVSGGTDDWNTAANWSLGHIPYAGALETDPLNEQAKITCAAGAGPDIGTGDVVTAYRVFVGATGNGELTIDGGSLSTLGYMTAAYNAADVAVINMLSGNVEIGINNSNNGHFYMGRNGTTTLNMSGGTITISRNLNVAQYASAVSTINLSGGTLTANALVKTGTASINISGSGKLVLLGDDTAVVETWYNNGWINDGEDLYWDYDVTTPGATTVYVPEPATICIFAIGTLGLIRRKR
jgi:hypothetical protein